jgi:hypothetical protein
VADWVNENETADICSTHKESKNGYRILKNRETYSGFQERENKRN